MNSFNLQDCFLNKARKDKVRISIFLVNGYKLSGHVVGFDNYVILLNTDKGQQLVYKHAISSILPLEKIEIFNNEIEME